MAEFGTRKLQNVKHKKGDKEQTHKAVVANQTRSANMLQRLILGKLHFGHGTLLDTVFAYVLCC